MNGKSNKSSEPTFWHLTTGVFAKKPDISIDEEAICDSTIGYRIINFITIFQAISQYVKCKDCNGDIKFEEAGVQGLGFKLVLRCEKCKLKCINSCPIISDTYEINKRFIFATKLLNISFNGMEQFCSLMDLQRPMLKSFYNSIIYQIETAVPAIRQWSVEKAAQKNANTPNTEPSTDASSSIRLKKIDNIILLDTVNYIIKIITDNGFDTFLKFYDILGINVGPTLMNYCNMENEKLINGNLTHVGEMQNEARSAFTKRPKLFAVGSAVPRNDSDHDFEMDDIW